MDLFPIQHRCAIGADKDNMKKTLLQLIKELLNTCTYWHKAEEEREHYSSAQVPSSVERDSDFSFTNSLATSSLVL